MSAEASSVWTLMQTIAAGDSLTALQMLAATPALATERLMPGASRQRATDFFLEPITHYAYGGDTGLHIAAAAYQLEVARALVAAGADLNAADGSKVRPLHRAVRTRCASAVRALLDSGADPSLANGNGSTPLDVATRQTGRGGSGGPQAKAEQADIIRLLESPKGR